MVATTPDRPEKYLLRYYDYDRRRPRATSSRVCESMALVLTEGVRDTTPHLLSFGELRRVCMGRLWKNLSGLLGLYKGRSFERLPLEVL